MKPRRKVTEVPRPSDPTSVADKVVNEEMDDSLKRAITTATSLDAYVHNDEDMFGVNDLDGDEVIVKSVDVAEQSKEVVDDITLAKALMEIKSAKPKALKVKDKGKGKMVKPEPVKKLSKKDQLMLDEELALKLQAEEEEEEKEQDELTDAEKEKLFMQFLEKRRKLFANKRANEKRNIPPTRAQQRSIMFTYLKNMEGWKLKSLKKKSFAKLQELFDKAMKKVNTFVDFRTELVEEISKKVEAEITQEGSLKRVGDELEQERSKK
nr:hypothetical protein [Tanacetum cinerariifolium]